VVMDGKKKKPKQLFQFLSSNLIPSSKLNQLEPLCWDLSHTVM